MLLYPVFMAILHGSSIALVALLLATTCLYGVRWHPVVGVLLWQSIPLALLYLLHYPFYDQLRNNLPILLAERQLSQQYTNLARFCAADAIFLYIFGAIGSGLTVSFTLSLFAVVVKSRNPKMHSTPRTWRSFQWLWDPSTTALCVGPFIWALPILGAGIEALVRTSRNQYPSIYYSQTYCNIDDSRYQFIAGLLLGLPLLVSVALAIATLAMIIYIYAHGSGTVSQPISLSLAFRFTLIVLQIFTTGVMLLCEISLRDDRLKSVFRFHVYWAASAPFVLFFVFGTQTDLIRIWKNWGYRLAGRKSAVSTRPCDNTATLRPDMISAANKEHFLVCTTTPSTPVLPAAIHKAHRDLSFTSRHDLSSVSDSPGVLAAKRSLETQRDTPLAPHHDLEKAFAAASDRSWRRQSRSITPRSLSTHPSRIGASFPATSTANTSQVDLTFIGDPQPSQLLASAVSSSVGHGSPLHDDSSRSSQPLATLADGLDVIFGAQVPSARTRRIGQVIISRQERDRHMAMPSAPHRSSLNEAHREGHRTPGLPPPPRARGQSNANAHPSSAGRGSTSVSGPGVTPVSTPVAAAWSWDSTFHSSVIPVPATAHTRDSASIRRGEVEGSGIQDRLQAPSSTSLAQEQSSMSDAYGSPLPTPRVSVASDWTFE